MLSLGFFRRLVRLSCAAALFVSLAPRVATAEVTGASLAGTLSGSGVSTVFATHAPGRPNDLFVLDQRGFIQVLNLQTGTFNATPFLNIQSLVDDGGNEQGLLGLAFDPNYETNGYFYVNYTRDPGPGLDRTRIDRFEATNPLTATTVSAGTRSSVLEFDQDFSNHNGGWIGFGPNDGLLYIATGDGGSGNDPNDRGQSLNTRLGKILRVDVTGDDFPSDNTENYAVPEGNPFVNDGDARTLDEIWAYGLRNPYRASFDRLTGDLWIGDVGQGAREEINRQPANRTEVANYGWRLREGDIQTPGSVGGPIPPNYLGPVYDYISDGAGQFGGNSVVGGYVYRGPDPEVQGRYFFADSFPTQLWSFDPADPDGTVQNIESVLNPTGAINTPVSFGEDAFGNLYIVSRGGRIFRIETDALAPGDYNADGKIDAADFAAWREDYGAAESLADGNNDGAVDAIDYAIWRESLSSPAALAAQDVEGPSVPEPNTTALVLGVAILLGLMTLLRNRFDHRAAAMVPLTKPRQ